MSLSSEDDLFFMRQALRAARLGVGETRPNPPVGAVVVDGAGQLLGRGHHHKAGGPHAEVNAVGACGDADLSGATLYVTLEPCSTTGRTPPCTDLILAKRFRRVVVGCTDPNPKHAGRGIDLLRAAGVQVDVGVCEAACRELIAPFASAMLRKRPRVTLKLALTLDGRIADREGTSKWITGAASRSYVQRLRRAADAILVGSGTVLADDPQLICHQKDCVQNAWRIVVDSRGRIPADARVLTDEYAGLTVVATTAPGAARLSRTLPIGAAPQVWTLPADTHGHVGLRALMARLTADLDVMSLLCEGGGEMAGALLRAGLVDQLELFYAPVILGDDQARSGFAGINALLEEGRLRVAARQVRVFGEDTHIRLDLAP